MKKTYIQPSTEEVKVTVQNLIMASGDPEVSFNPNDQTDVMESLGFGSNLWED